MPTINWGIIEAELERTHENRIFTNSLAISHMLNAMIIRALPDRPYNDKYPSSHALADEMDRRCSRDNTYWNYWPVLTFEGAAGYYATVYHRNSPLSVLAPERSFGSSSDWFDFLRRSTPEGEECIAYHSPATFLTSVIDKLPWEAREFMKCELGIYEQLPWKNLDPIKGHHAHISEEDKTMIAFVETPEKGARGIKLRMKPGRYLTRFYPGLDPTRVQALAAEVNAIYDLRFAKTAEEIVAVYKKGPQSCMSHSEASFSGHCHPVSVYGDSDLQLAYLTVGEFVKARALVWPDKKKIGRAYGDQAEKLVARLQQEGYDMRKDSMGYDLFGARIRRIPNENGRGLIMPYVDGFENVKYVDSVWIELDDGGDINCRFTSGVDWDPEAEDEEDTYHCDHCGENEDDVWDVRVRSARTEQWCYSCRSNHAVRSISLGCYLSEERATEVVVAFDSDGDPSRRDYIPEWSSDYYTCEGSNELVYDEVAHVKMHDGSLWAEAYFNAHGIEVDGKCYRKGEEPKTEETTNDTEPACEAADTSIAEAA